MKRTLGVAVVVFVFGLIGLNCLPVHAQEKAITLNFANFFPPKHRVSLLLDQWCTEVNKRTNGRVKVTHFTGGILCPAPQTYASVIGGVADIGVSFVSYTTGRFPVTEFLIEPIGCKDGYWGTKLANALYKKFKPKEFDETKVMFLLSAPPQFIFGQKPIKTLEDLKGRKLRAAGTVEVAFVRALGGVPVALPMPDVYDALQKGAIEGYCGNFEPMKGYKLAEVLKYSVEFDARPMGSGYVVMNKDKWNALPADVQKIIDEINEEYAEKMAELWRDLAQEGKDFFVQKGGTVIVLSKEENARWVERVRPIVDEYVKGLNSKGLPGDEVLKFCMDYLKTHQK